jgi:predicted permease
MALTFVRRRRRPKAVTRTSLGLLYLGFSGRLLLHPLLALLGVALLHALLKRPYPWPGVGFLLRGFAPLALSPV